ncbi:uncharacterized protein LOC135082306 [Ostrinia nubilalis]|uniref:uncharacterized protein LOC135082306 n=1 Tax=Ostrinia nubilalis TaxID=29057 RepID=UPI0030824387
MLGRANIIIVLIIMFMPRSFIEGVMHPAASIEKPMTCEEFGQSARFNPYSVLGDVWMAFYYWAPHEGKIEFKFVYPKPRERAFLRELLSDQHVTVPVNWTARFVVMEDQGTRESLLLVENGDRGQYWLYPFARGVEKETKVEPLEIRIKQTSNNKYIGLMYCKRETVYVLVRRTEIPPKAKIQDAAACIGYRGRGGRSYLYQGHHWMPIGEADEDEYWNPEKHYKKHQEELRQAEKLLKMEKRKKRNMKNEADDFKVEKNILL